MAYVKEKNKWGDEEERGARKYPATAFFARRGAPRCFFTSDFISIARTHACSEALRVCSQSLAYDMCLAPQPPALLGSVDARRHGRSHSLSRPSGGDMFWAICSMEDCRTNPRSEFQLSLFHRCKMSCITVLVRHVRIIQLAHST